MIQSHTMKKYYFILLFGGMFSLITKAQVIYSDQFDAYLTTESSSPYDVSLVDGNLTIQGDGTAENWDTFEYTVHDAGEPTTFDMKSAPQIFIKVKASEPGELRIDVRDADGYVSNLSAKSVFPTKDFVVYMLDYAGDFKDGGYGGSPCESASAPCSVEPAAIAELVFFVDPGSGGYNGTIEIDWISIGEPLEAPLPPVKNLRYNQVGYHLNREKLINLTCEADFEPLPYTVVNADGEIVASGMTSAPQLWNESQEYVATIDVSEISTEDVYVITVDEEEAEFRVSLNVYEELHEAAFKYYYFNRASTEITAEFGGVYARPLGLPDTEVRVHASAASDARPEGTVISAPKGWYDAGDYNKYIVNSGISTYTLLAAFEHYPTYFGTKAYDIPETNNDIPDLLDEVKWNLDWMLDMQDPNDGGVYHKLTGLSFQGIIMPADYTADRYVVQKTTSAALNFAAVTAMASRIFADYETQLPGYSAQLIAASKLAYNWAQANPTVYYNQPHDVHTGTYGDNNVSDEFQWSAVELFITTGEQTYNNAIDVGAIGNGIPSWNYTAPLALISIVSNAERLSSNVDVASATAKLLETANRLKEKVNNSAMRVAMGAGDFKWGSNGQAGNQMILLIIAYQIDGDESFLDAAFTASDYLLGRNATGYCFVSGFGDLSMNNPHHRISDADGVVDAIPGMIAGGPQSGQQDGCPGYPSSAPARSYVDTWCSYATNEVTINWNAPLFYWTAALSRNRKALLVKGIQDMDANPLKIYPNPSAGFINIHLGNASNLSVKVFTMDGKLIIDQELESTRPLNINSIIRGMYIIQVESEGEKYEAIFLKS